MKKRLALAVSAMLAIGMLTGCGSKAEPAATTAAAAETTAEASKAEETKAEESKAEETTAAEEAAADNPFNGATVKVGCSATFVPYESIEMAADGSKTYVGMNIDLITAIVEKNGGTVEFVDMPFKSLMAANVFCTRSLQVFN